jgi:hypothetical protein
LERAILWVYAEVSAQDEEGRLGRIGMTPNDLNYTALFIMDTR